MSKLSLANDIYYIRRIIEEMPRDLALVLILFHYENMSQREIALHIKKPVSVVRSRIGKGKFMLKKKLDDKDLLDAYRIIYPNRFYKIKKRPHKDLQ